MSSLFGRFTKSLKRTWNRPGIDKLLKLLDKDEFSQIFKALQEYPELFFKTKSYCGFNATLLDILIHKNLLHYTSYFRNIIESLDEDDLLLKKVLNYRRSNRDPTLLMLAGMNGNGILVKFLLSKNADYKMIAISSDLYHFGKLDILMYTILGFINHRNKGVITKIIDMLNENINNYQKSFITINDRYKITPLILAAWLGLTDVVYQLYKLDFYKSLIVENFNKSKKELQKIGNNEIEMLLGLLSIRRCSYEFLLRVLEHLDLTIDHEVIDLNGNIRSLKEICENRNDYTSVRENINDLVGSKVIDYEENYLSDI